MPGPNPQALNPPDLRPYRDSNSGVPYVQLLDSGRSGPTVMVQALTHGNELCGAIALDWLLRQGPPRPRQGRLILSFGNVAAFERFDPAKPGASRCVDEDLNRVWADEQLFGPRDSLELRRARALRPFVDAADLLLDLHSMQDDCQPLMLCGLVDKGVALARRLGTPAELLIDTGHSAGLRMRDRGGFADPASPRTALLIECGQHGAQSSADVALDCLLRFLQLAGMLEPDWLRPHRQRLLPLPARQRLLRVDRAITAHSSDFHFLRPVRGLELIPEAGTPLARDGEQLWHTPYADTVLVMPSLRGARPGHTMVRLGRYED
ncbi:UNVERIFIED_ORG: succinylglutamate desuccinylase/aspartoacylase family protein [Shinella sp. XGS7]|nr:succinylglutamate desuccinylase/aspartoacylase family protein [Shinella sp. XGS7]